MENEHFSCVSSPELSYNNYRKLPRKVLNKVFCFLHAIGQFAVRNLPYGPKCLKKMLISEV